MLVDELLDSAVQPHDRKALREDQPERPQRPDGRLDRSLERRGDEEGAVRQSVSWATAYVYSNGGRWAGEADGEPIPG